MCCLSQPLDEVFVEEDQMLRRFLSYFRPSLKRSSMYALGASSLIESDEPAEFRTSPLSTKGDGEGRPRTYTQSSRGKSWEMLALLANFQGILSEDSLANASTSDGSCSSLAG